jgi:hypothetical protein
LSDAKIKVISVAHFSVVNLRVESQLRVDLELPDGVERAVPPGVNEMYDCYIFARQIVEKFGVLDSKQLYIVYAKIKHYIRKENTLYLSHDTYLLLNFTCP